MKAVAAYLAAVSGSSATLLLIFLALGHTDQGAALPAVLVGATMAWLAWRLPAPPADQGEARRPPGIVGWCLLVLAAIFVARAGLWLAWELNGNLYVGSPYNLGDFCLHLTHVNHLLKPVPFWPDNPISGGEPLTYPPGMALWHVLLVWLGMPVLGAFSLATLLGLSLGVAAAWRWGRAVGLAVLLLNGGIAGWAILGTAEWTDYQADIAWKSIPLTMLVTQRGFLYALPAGLWLMNRWQRCFVQGRRELNWFDAWIYGTLPLFHLHTFLALTACMFTWVLINPERRRVVLHGLAAAIPATALGWLVTGGGANTGVSGPAWGWFDPEGAGIGKALWLNFGPWMILLPCAVLLLGRRLCLRHAGKAEREAALWIIPGVGLLLFSLVWKLQPWAWDNTKLMLWGWLAAAPCVWRLGLRHVPDWVRFPAGALLFGSGLVTLIGGMRFGLKTGGYRIASTMEIAAAALARDALPAGTVVAAAPAYNQPLLLAGQGVVLGYDGHLWSHGIDYMDRLELLDTLMNGEPGWEEAAKRLQVRHLYLGNMELQVYPEPSPAWSIDATIVHEDRAGTLYKLP